MKTVLKKAFSGQADIKMEDVLDLTLQLEDLGVDADEIDHIIADFEASQANGTHRAEDFIRDVVRLYRLKDGDVLPDFQKFVYEPAQA